MKFSSQIFTLFAISVVYVESADELISFLKKRYIELDKLAFCRY